MGSVRARNETGKLFFDFHYQGKRCREQTTLDDNPANQKKLKQILGRIEAEITLGTFEYASYFPNSPRAKEMTGNLQRNVGVNRETPLFSEFAELWMSEMKVQWRKSHIEGVETTLRKYINPFFGEKEVGCITKAEILEFRAQLGKVTKKNGASLTSTRINHIITPLRMILNESANRYEFTSPYHGIKSLKVPKTDVQPFTLEEVKRILTNVRDDYRPYYSVRFFTGMRTGEIDGLLWQYVDFERRQILIRQSLVRGEMNYTKNDGSFRTIDMSDVVYEALREQQKVTQQFDFVFCNREGKPLRHNNVTLRIWKPLLNYLKIRQRRPYQTRHTAATLWLAAGESPEWIARQMGHTTTEMLFRVYSRYVPNLTRQDGTAMEKLLRANGFVAEEVAHARD